ncbi:aminopeptidase N-like [Chrysoperla carnea]|uniref:aminopeptidase N-like n=1 Tax=Chrysoperla carnea TaxID=189513 RepID=UPI001D07E2CF|nr:aminopeptidase N-like [Chrysoperla carnea]
MISFYLLKLIILLTIFDCNYGHYIHREDFDNTTFRLPKHIIPQSYDLQLTSYLNEKHNENRNFTFDGNIKIVITNTKEDNNEIILHARKLKYNDDDISITNVEGTKLKFKKDYNQINQFLTLTLTDTKLKENNDYIINIKYQGVISKFWEGYYRSRYTDSDDDYVTATQFSANAARKAFPCFDEPGIKATFKLTMNHHKNYVALSNMPFIETRQADEDSDRKITIFDTTNVKLSTFLIAFALINYNITPKNGVRQTIYVPEFLQKYTKFSLDHAQKSLDFMEKYTNIEYKLPKLDHLAVPEFAAGAMENWGLIAYKTSKLIYNPEKNTVVSKQDVARVISHEISHQWFGNLVTPEWWDFIWLSEGFATYMEYFIVNKIFPEWRMMDQFVVNVQQKIMLYDVTDKTHPIDLHVDNPDFWSADLIVYQKGGSILRMISYIIGEENFKKGLHTYLKELSEDVTNNEKLWKYLQTVSPENVDIAKIGSTWIKNTGFPVVSIVRRYSENQYELKQKPFLFLQEDVKEKLWSIPIRIVTKSNLDFTNLSPTHFMHEKEMSISTSSRNEDDKAVDPKNWYILNPEQTGYYRVNYDLVNWQSITEFLNSPEYDKIQPATRAQLIDDSLHLAEAGELGFDVALSLTKYLELETDLIPWTAAVSALQRVHINAMQSDYDTYYKVHIQTISEAMYKKLIKNFEETDDHLINLGRTKILLNLCNVDNKDCIEHSENILINNISQNKEAEDIPIDLQGVIYCNGIKNGNETVWQKLYEKKYLDNSNEIERNNVAFGLGCSSDPKILENYLSMLLEPKIEESDLTAGFEGIVTNLPIGVSVALDFLEQNIDKIRETFHDTSLVTIMEKFAEHLIKPEQVQRFKDAIGNLEYREFLMDNAIKIAENNLKWHENHNEELKDWFTKTVIIPTTSTDNPAESTPGEATPTTADPSSAKSNCLSLMFLPLSIFIFFIGSLL